MNGHSAQLHVERGLKSGLELAPEVMGHVKERLQRPKIAVWLGVKELANGKNGVHGQCAQQHVAKEPKSGLELAMEVSVLVQESGQRPKIAFWISVQ